MRVSNRSRRARCDLALARSLPARDVDKLLLSVDAMSRGTQVVATSSWTLLPIEGPPKEMQDVSSVEHGLTAVTSHLHKASATGHKERVDLAALQRHMGTTYAQIEAVPNAVFNQLRQQLHNVVPIVLLPPGTPPFSTEAICMFADAHGGIKGLPPNKRGTMLLNACGLKGHGEIRGDCFLAHLEPNGASGVALGGPFAPPKIAQRDWLEAAQKAQAKGASPSAAALEASVAALLETARRNQVAQAVAAAAAPKVPAAPPPATAASTPPSTSSAAAPPADVSDPTPPPASSEGCGVVEFADGSDEVTASVLVPAGTKAKHISFKLTDETLRVEVHTLPEGKRVVIDGSLFQEVVAKDSNWSLEDVAKAPNGERKLQITLEKKAVVGGTRQARWLMLTR